MGRLDHDFLVVAFVVKVRMESRLLMVLMVNVYTMIIGQRICGENDFLVVASVAEVRMEGRLSTPALARPQCQL